MCLVLILLNLYLVDQPDIVVPEHGTYTIQLRFGPRGEIIGYGNLGLWNRLSLGLSYGASNLIGAGNPEFYSQPGIQIRILAIEPGLVVPAVIFGFDNQGYGTYDDSRYEIMSKGLYCQVGEIFEYPGLKIKPSLGLNYCFEEDGRLDLFGGVMFQFGSSTQFLADYSPNLSDPNDQNKGYMNLALRFVFYEQLFFEFALRDLLDNSGLQDTQLNRLIKISFQDTF